MFVVWKTLVNSINVKLWMKNDCFQGDKITAHEICCISLITVQCIKFQKQMHAKIQLQSENGHVLV